VTTDGPDEGELRELVATAGRVLYQQGLVDYLGHLSARVPGTDRVVVKPKHSTRTRGMHSLTAADMVVVDLDGRLVEGEERAPAEVFIHTEIYRARPDVLSVCHTHQPSATLLGVIGADLLPVLHVPSVLTDGGRMPTWPCPLLVTSPERGSELAAALGDATLCHLQGHGIVTVAADVPTATVVAVALEQLAEANLRILQTGRSPRAITAEEVAELRREAAPVAGRWAYFLQLLDEG
jgi:ribulose-5-phosphate 4-epimerase/fuculose-1-phosphate aldolase